jgi:plasmid stabilization system protein ParE
MVPTAPEGARRQRHIDPVAEKEVIFDHPFEFGPSRANQRGELLLRVVQPGADHGPFLRPQGAEPSPSFRDYRLSAQEFVFNFSECL